MKRRLDEEGKKEGRNLSQEAERRLDQSFAQESLLNEVLVLAYGREVAGILRILARVMSRTGRIAAFEASGSFEKSDDWLSDPYAFDQVAWAVATIMDGLRPAGGRGFRQSFPTHASAITPEVVGQHQAVALLWKLRHPEDRAQLPESAEYLDLQAFAHEVRELLRAATITVPKLATRKDAAERLAAAEVSEPSGP